MPIYSTLQEALLAGQLATRDYKANVSDKTKIEAKFVQKKDSEFKPVVKGTTAVIEQEEPVEPVPIIKDPEIDPNIAARERLRQRIEELNRESAAVPIDENAPQVDSELYEEPPSMVKGLAVDLIDPAFTKSQIIKGSSKVQQLYGEQNQIKPIAKLIARTKSRPLRVLEQGLLNAPINFIRHPIVSLQKSYLHDPIENRDMLFSIAVNEMVQKAIFPDNPELAFTLPDDFIKDILEQGKKIRNRNIGVQLFHATSDFLSSLSPFLDSQQRRALDLLQKKIKEDPQGFLKDIEEKNLKYSSDHAQGFALTLTKGDDLIPDQTRLGNSQILYPGEQREEIEDVNHVIQTRIKDLIKPYVVDKSTLDSSHKKQLIKEVVEIYKETGLITEEDLNSGKKVANNILSLIDDLTKDPADQEHYLAHWPELKIVSYLAQSTGEAQGGQERFFTWNQELTFKMHQDHMKVDKGKGIVASTLKESIKSLPKNIALGTLRTGTYFAGYLASYGIGLAKGVPKSAVGSAIWAGFWPLGPLWSGTIGAMAEGGSDYNSKLYKHESNVTKQERQASREKTLRRGGSDSDFVRSELDEALVTAVPARDLTESISKLVLKDQNNWSSETNENLTADQATEILLNIANIRARLTLSLRSGYKDIEYKTQNWVSYTEGREQEEMTNLKAASLQGFWRIKHLQDLNPGFLTALPLYEANGGDLEKIVECYSTIIQTGLREGLPIGQLENSPLKDFKSKRFYKQIFEASGVDESEISQIENLLSSLKNDKKVISGKTMYQWLDESESLKTRMKIFNKLKVERSISGAATSAISSLVIIGAKKGIEYVSESLTANHQPVAPASPDQGPEPTPKTTQIIDLPNFFKSSPDSNSNPISIFDPVSNTNHVVNIPTAHGLELRFDGNDHYDLVRTSDDSVVYQDIFILDKSHNAFVPNQHFVPDSTHPTIEADLSQQIKFATDQQEVVITGTPVELTGGAVIVAYLKEHFPKAMSEIAHRDVYKDQNPQTLTTFVDTEGKIHITQGGYSAPNITGGPPQSLSAGLENGNGSLWFTFGKNADRSLSQDSTPLSFEGIQVPLIWHVKGNGGFADFVFDPRHPDLNNPQVELLSKLVDLQALAKFQEMGPNHWLNQKDLGELFMGLRGYEGGFMKVGPDGKLTMEDYRMEFVGDNDKLIIAPPDRTTYTPFTQLVPPGPVKVIIPGETPLPIVETPPPTVKLPDYTPLLNLLQKWHSPQLNPTISEGVHPVSSTPLPASIINQNEFKKEAMPARVDNLVAKEFIDRLVVENLPINQKAPKVDDFIISRYFTESQQRFLRNQENRDFITDNISNEVGRQKPGLKTKIERSSPQALTRDDKRDLKEIVSQVAKDNNYTEKEALIMAEFMIQQSFYDNLFWAVTELNAINEKLAEATAQLNNLPRPRVDTEPPVGHKMTDEEFADMFFNLQEAEDRKPTKEGKEEISDLFHEFVIYKLTPKEQGFFKDEVFVNNFVDYQQILLRNHRELMDKVYGGKPLTTDDKEELKLTIRQINNQPSDYQKIAIFNYFVAANTATVILNQEEKKREKLNQVEIKVMDVDSTISYDQNRKAADQFIAILRDPKRLKTSPTWPENYLVHDYGFVFDRNNGGTVSNPELIESRYHLPFATYSNHLIPSVSHANLVIRGPRLDSGDGKWKIIIYDPYQFKFREEILTAAHNQEEALRYVHKNKLWEEDYSRGEDDIFFENDQELKPFLDTLIEAKLSPFQQDMINCYPYCFFVGAMLNALKPGKTEFKTQGIAQFLKDYQLNILDRDEVLRRLKKS